MTTETKSQENEPEVTETNPVVEALELQKKISELEKDLAIAKRDALLTKLPSSETKGASGSVTLGEKTSYFAEQLAYETLADAADEIATAVGKGPGTMVLTDELDFATKKHLWGLIKGRLESFSVEFNNILDRTKNVQDADDLGAVESVGALLTALPAVLGGIADVAAFFKVDQEIRGRDVELNKYAIMAEVARAMNDWNVVLPKLNTSKEGALVKLLDEVKALERSAKARRRELEALVKKPLASLAEKRKALKALQGELAKLEKATNKDNAKIAARNAEIDALEDEIQPLTNLERVWKGNAADFDALLAAWKEYEKVITVGSSDKAAPIESLALVDLIEAIDGAHRLHVDIVSDGAEVHITKSIWSSGRISYVGGSVCVFFWVDDKGKIKKSDSISLWKAKSFKARKGSEKLPLA